MSYRGVICLLSFLQRLLGNNNAKEIKKMSNANILVVDSKYKVEIGSDVKYISSNCKVDEDGIVTTSDKEMSYIVY